MPKRYRARSPSAPGPPVAPAPLARQHFRTTAHPADHQIVALQTAAGILRLASSERGFWSQRRRDGRKCTTRLVPDTRGFGFARERGRQPCTDGSRCRRNHALSANSDAIRRSRGCCCRRKPGRSPRTGWVDTCRRSGCGPTSTRAAVDGRSCGSSRRRREKPRDPQSPCRSGQPAQHGQPVLLLPRMTGSLAVVLDGGRRRPTRPEVHVRDAAPRVARCLVIRGGEPGFIP